MSAVENNTSLLAKSIIKNFIVSVRNNLNNNPLLCLFYLQEIVQHCYLNNSNWQWQISLQKLQMLLYYYLLRVTYNRCTMNEKTGISGNVGYTSLTKYCIFLRLDTYSTFLGSSSPLVMQQMLLYYYSLHVIYNMCTMNETIVFKVMWGTSPQTQYCIF